MAPKKKEYPVNLRQTVIKHYLNGDSEHEIAQKLIIPRTSVHYMIDKYKKTKCVQTITGRRRKRKTTVYHDRATHRKIKADRRIPASSVKAVIKTGFGIIISEQMLRRRLHETGLKDRVARKKPYVDRTNRMKRIQHAKKYREQPLCFRDQVLWTGESKFNLFEPDERIVVWRTPQEALDPRCTVPTVKHRGGNVKCWDCISSSGVGNLVFIDGNMTGEVCRDTLQGLFESVKKLNLGRNRVLQHDNDLKHRAHIVTKWLDEKGVELLKWSSFSPGLNSIEHT